MATPTPSQDGPLAWQNWRAHLRKAPELSWFEFGLYSDAHFYGVVEGDSVEGPYQILNALNTPWMGSRAGPDLPELFVRASWYLTQEMLAPSQMDTTNHGSYHGGDLQDELAALLSLTMGVRLRAGGLTRQGATGDPLGRPQADIRRPIPMSGTPSSARILPDFHRDRTVTDELFETYFALPAADAIALVRAARLYQDAVWIAEAEPQLSWLMLVSSIEVVAGRQAESGTAIELFRELEADLAAKLAKTCGEQAVALVADHLARQLRATKKFRDFAMRFLPAAPEQRPRDWLQLDWSEAALRKTLTKVYSHRSLALHAGTPFPHPMCRPPFRFQADEPYAEIPVGLSAAAQGGIWV